MGDAEFSGDCERRYWLTRDWSDSGSGAVRDTPSGPLCAFVGLNPSTADRCHDDLTVRSCQLRAREDWGFGGFVMLNLFSYRDTRPNGMWDARGQGTDIVGDNDRHLHRWAAKVNATLGKHHLGEGGMVIAAWGNAATKDRAREADVISILRQHGPVYCLDHTNAGCPRHPRGVRRGKKPKLWLP
jgi:hypothetical protein